MHSGYGRASSINGFASVRDISLCIFRIFPSRFYGSSKHAELIPGAGFISNDDFTSDSDDDNIPLSNLHLSKHLKPPIRIPSSDTDSSENKNIIDPKSKIRKKSFEYKKRWW